jgi:PAS domain S-box-containing protein
MIDGLPLLPAVIVEFIGAAVVIVLAFVAVVYARALVKMEPTNFIWGFLWYLSIAMAVFSLSRGVGHIVRICLVFSNRSDLWQQLSPLSGGFNTMLMISVASVTIYYHKGLAAFNAIGSEAKKLTAANQQLESSTAQLQRLNTDLEEMVEERTRDLSNSEKKFRNFFENSKDIVYFSDIVGNVTDINSSGLQMLGVANSPGTLNFHSLFKNTSELETYLENIVEHGFVSDLEVECLGADGAIRNILLSANAIYDENNHITGYEGIGKDMTRLKTMTEQLINHEKMASVGQMAAGVAHEINTPLGIILGYTQLMMDDFEPESETHNNMLVIERQTKACRKIVSDLLKFSRQSASAKAPININDIIQDVLSVIEHTLNIHKIHVVQLFGADLPPVIGDSEKLHQVFINMFNNSQYAMPDGGLITITTTRRGNEVHITVQDNGTGIGEEIKNKIFDPFFTTKDVGKGTGLGLSVTYGIIHEHGGEVWVESPVVNLENNEKESGAAFHIRLPAYFEKGTNDV